MSQSERRAIQRKIQSFHNSIQILEKSHEEKAAEHAAKLKELESSLESALNLQTLHLEAVQKLKTETEKHNLEMKAKIVTEIQMLSLCKNERLFSHIGSIRWEESEYGEGDIQLGK